MTSVILTRRAMLSGGALMGLSTLLAACGQPANNEASASASSTASQVKPPQPPAVSRPQRALLHPLSAAIPAVQRHPMESTAKPMGTALPRTFRSRVKNLHSTLKPKKVL